MTAKKRRGRVRDGVGRPPARAPRRRLAACQARRKHSIEGPKAGRWNYIVKPVGFDKKLTPEFEGAVDTFVKPGSWAEK